MQPGKPGGARGRKPGGPGGNPGGNPAGQGEQSEDLGRQSFSAWFSRPVVESGRKWVKVVESGRKWGKWGEAKVHRDHPGWFSAVRAPLGYHIGSTFFFCYFLGLPPWYPSSSGRPGCPPIHYLSIILCSESRPVNPGSTEKENPGS